jgi:hypothetical protein
MNDPQCCAALAVRFAGLRLALFLAPHKPRMCFPAAKIVRRGAQPLDSRQDALQPAAHQ